MAKLVHTNEAYAVKATDDYNDCAIRAIATAGCLPYGEVSGLAFYYGRKRYKGTPLSIISQMIEHLFPGAQFILSTDRWYDKKPTLKQFAEKHSQGHYVVITKRHAFALCDGVVHDWSLHSRYRIESAFKLC